MPASLLSALKSLYATEQSTGFTDRIYRGDTGASHFDNIMMISAEDAKSFPLKQAYKSPIFLRLFV